MISFKSVLISLRPLQWLKNLAVFAAILFSGKFFQESFLLPVFASFWIFNILSSSMYLVNDVFDIERDKAHLYKRLRPIAQGKIDKNLALVISLFLTIAGLYTSFQLSTYLFTIALVFIILQLTYNFLLKFIILLDITTIALGFMLRVFAGSFIIGVPLSSWLILTTIMLSLLLASGKRRAELTILTHKLAAKHRETLYYYPTKFLDGVTFMMGTATLITYSIFTFNELETHSKEFIISFLPQTLASPKWLMATIPLVVYGILRYLYLIFEGKGESPEKVLVTDFPLLATIILWLSSVFIIIYLVPS
ncbi:MAG: decaprenyl-phosphate phosphoribosyltransferase [Candidatus Woykebacteria bacterium]